MYTRENIIKGVRNPRLILREAKKLIGRGGEQIARWRFYNNNGDPCDIMDEDWDFLIILDACRYDMLNKLDWFGEEVERRLSKASHSREFAIQNFDGKNYFDTVYITANGHLADVAQDSFHDFIFTDLDGFSDDYDTIHPSHRGLAPNTVYNAAMDAYNQYPNKRLIIHFMQPHAPYLGEYADEIRDKLGDQGYYVKTRNNEETDPMDVKEGEITLVRAARRGLITQEELRKAYMSNLKEVLHYVDLFINEFDGKFSITADHGEFLGENGKFAQHPKRTYHQKLRYVPWVEIESGQRRDIAKTPPVESEMIGDDIVERRLQALGYKD